MLSPVVKLSRQRSTKLLSPRKRLESKATRLGVGILVTCRQAYDKGHTEYYTSNIFCLPPSSFEEMEQLLPKIRPEHLSMMRHVTLKLSLIDLTPSVLLAVEDKCIAFPSRTCSSSDKADLYGCVVHGTLRYIWQDKLHLARSTFGDLIQLVILQAQSVNLKSTFGGVWVPELRAREIDGLYGHQLKREIGRGLPYRNTGRQGYDVMVSLR